MPLMEHPAFKRPSRGSTLWRYMDLAKFVDLLARRALFFPAADRLGDPLEGSYPPANRSIREGLYGGNDVDLLTRRRHHLAQATVVSCWHVNRRESAAMWEIYARTGSGIAIRTTFGDLLDSLTSDPSRPDRREIYAGMVKYIDFEKETIDESTHLSPFIHKRLSFEYEHEVRLVVGESRDTYRGWQSARRSHGEYFDVDPRILIRRVYVAPQARDWVKDVVQAVVTKFGLELKVERSEMDKTPFI